MEKIYETEEKFNTTGLYQEGLLKNKEEIEFVKFIKNFDETRKALILDDIFRRKLKGFNMEENYFLHDGKESKIVKFKYVYKYFYLANIMDYKFDNFFSPYKIKK